MFPSLIRNCLAELCKVVGRSWSTLLQHLIVYVLEKPLLSQNITFAKEVACSRSLDPLAVVQ